VAALTDYEGLPQWRCEALDDRSTRIELDLRIDPGRLVPGLVRAAISDDVMRRALTDLQRHLEG
jgi:hypothetical protein